MLQVVNKPLNTDKKQGQSGADLAALMTWPQVSARVVDVEGGQMRLRLETAVWDGLDVIARMEGKSAKELCAQLDSQRSKQVSLTSSIRSYVLDYFRRIEAA